MDRLQAIFNRQHEMVLKYLEIESRNGFHANIHTVPVDINDRFGQARIKDTAWRLTEELGEALDSFQTNPMSYHEEMSDALHFLTELSILSGFKPEDILTSGRKSQPYPEGYDLIEILFHKARMGNQLEMYMVAEYPPLVYLTGRVIESLTLAMNCLKNKPWKQTLKETDTDRFYYYIKQTWIKFALLCIIAGMDEQKFHDAYFAKSRVNKQRQSSGY